VLLVQVAGGVILVVLVLAFLLRGRFGATSANDKPASSSRPKAPAKVKEKSKADFRPTLPPSPYQPSRGFKILDGNEPEAPHEIQLPRLDPHKEFVFNDHLASSSESLSAPHLRHDERWALDRSMRRAPHPRVRRRRRLAWVLLIALLAAGLIAVLLVGAHPKTHPKSSPAIASAYAVAPSSWMM